ncbi:MAG: PP2C family protein-serine/threonine phosphatase [Phycisphaerales bacterium]
MPSEPPIPSGEASGAAATAVSVPAAAPHTMVCMEVWGGNHATNQGVVMPGLDVWVFSEPYMGDDMGGDVHYVSSCGTGRISRLIIADVSGHGETVAEFARGLRTLMRRFVNYLDQTRFVEALNKGLVEVDETGRFATSVAMTFFAPSRHLEVCNAGHPRPLWYHAAERRWEPLDAGVARNAARAGGPSNLPLGVLEPTQYEQFGVQLRRGDLVLAYTDALVEARAGDGRMLGEEGLLALVSTIDVSQPEQFVPTLLGRLAAFRGGAASDDDLTLLLIRHNGLGTQAPFVARLGASVRFLGMVGRHLLHGCRGEPVPWPEPRKQNILGAFSRRVAESWRGQSAARR